MLSAVFDVHLLKQGFISECIYMYWGCPMEDQRIRS